MCETMLLKVAVIDCLWSRLSMVQICPGGLRMCKNVTKVSETYRIRRYLAVQTGAIETHEKHRDCAVQPVHDRVIHEPGGTSSALPGSAAVSG